MDGNPQQGETSNTAVEARGAEVVKAVLSGQDCYAAIRAPRNVDRAQLCRAYVETAVQVHPAGNPHPDAERAFLSATAAWEELRCEETRQSYDRDLQRGIIVSPPDPKRFSSMDEARALFAQAWNDSLSGEVGNNMTEFAQVLSQGEQLVQETAPEQNAQPWQAAAGGLAFSVGLWAAGAVASGSGFGTVGSLAKRAAVVQGTSQLVLGGLAAYQRPDVREAIGSGLADAAERASGAGAAAATFAGRVAAKCPAPGCGEMWLPSCLPKPRLQTQEEDSQSESSCDPNALEKDDVVFITGLQSAVELNGKNGVILGFDKRKGRYQVRVLPSKGDVACDCEGFDKDTENESSEADAKLIKRENLLRSRNSAPREVNEFI